MAETLQIRNFIDGQFVEPVGGRYLDNIEPATGKRIRRSPIAMRATSSWPSRQPKRHSRRGRARRPRERSRLLLRIADLIERDLEKFARAESIDTGKPLSLARELDIPRAASNFRFFATAILHTETEAHLTDGVAFNYTLRQPRGVVGLISPWNLPLYLLTGRSRRPSRAATPPSPSRAS